MVASLIGLAVAVFGFAAMRDPMRLNLNPFSPSAKGYYQFGGKARKEHLIGIVHAGWRLRLIRIDGSSISDYRLV